jgi:antirestriction protein ArdC
MVQMPDFDRFETTGGYLATLAHEYVTSQVSSFRGQSMAFARCCFATIVWPAVRFQDGF